jgi:phosphoribosylformylglycinamidine synthase
MQQMIQLPNIASKRWIYTQYDSMVGAANLSTNAPSDAAIVWIKETGKALALTVDCNSRYAYANAYTGTMIAVAEAARNIICSGAQPLGITNCLNFGNPYNPEVYYQFVQAIKGMGEACRKWNTPVTGGNVSFYNQNPDGAVYPTPVIGMVGLIENLSLRMTLDFKEPEDIILLIGKQTNDIASSEYLHKIKKAEFSPAPYFNLEEEYNMQQFTASLIQQQLLKSAHDISEGGLLTTLFEKAFPRKLGFSLQPAYTIRTDAFWLGEAQGRIVATCSKEHLSLIEQQAAKNDIPLLILGTVTSGTLFVMNTNWGMIEEWKSLYNSAIEKILI